MRKVLVFRLVPIGDVARDLVDVAVDPTDPEELPLEASNIDAYVVGPGRRRLRFAVKRSW